jgi:CRP/FNR family cyclic AMP-dependent transcriptional regulator
MPTPDPIAGITKCGFLGRLSDPLRETLLDGAHRIEHPPGSAVYQGQGSRRLAVVLSGLVRIYVSAPDGRQITLSYEGAGALVGALSASPANVTVGVQALERSSLLHLDSARLDGLVMIHPELSWAIAQEMDARAANAHNTVAICAFAQVRARIASDLLARVRALGSTNRDAPIQTTHQELADAVGSVREVVSRAIRDLRNAGVIESNPDGLRIVNLDRLALEAEFSG